MEIQRGGPLSTQFSGVEAREEEEDATKETTTQAAEGTYRLLQEEDVESTDILAEVHISMSS